MQSDPPKSEEVHAEPQVPLPAPAEEPPLEVDPVADTLTPDPPRVAAHEPNATTATVPRTVQSVSRKRDRPGLLKHYRRHLNFLVLLFLFVGGAGWTYRWYVLREILLQFDRTNLPALAVPDLCPLLAETLRDEPSPARRARAAVLLGQAWNLEAPDYPYICRGRVYFVWEALLRALEDTDATVEDGAWEGLRGDRPHAWNSQNGLYSWLRDLPVGHCVEIVSHARSALLRESFLEALESAEADAYWKTACWTLQSLPDPETVDTILEDARRTLYAPAGGWRSDHRTSMLGCVRAGLANPDTGIRDRCRRLFLDYGYSGGPVDEFFDWIRTTRNVSTLDRVVHLVRVNSSLDWETHLKTRLAEETDFDAAVELSVALGNMVGQERDQEFLKAGLENPDPKIREYFEQLLAHPPIETEPPVEPDDGR